VQINLNILLVVNEQKDSEYRLSNRVAAIIGNRASLFLDGTHKEVLIQGAKKISKNDYSMIDVILVIGGDGTLLSVAKTAVRLDIPVIGINLGRLGFLSEIEQDEIEDGINKLLEGDYFIEERMLLCASLTEQQETIALNDIIVTRANATLKILELDVYIDDEYVDDFKADGIIISTPTGSTAYSLSAGGPIVDPSLDSMIITPVCPHKMYSRTIIVPPEKTIKVKCKTSIDNDAVVAADSEILGKLLCNESVTIRVAQQKFKLIRFKGYKFFGVLHNKLVKKED